MSGAAGAVAEGAGEKGLPHADGAEEDDVLAALEEGEAEEITDAVAVESDRRVPVEVFEGLCLFEAGAVEAVGEILVLAPIDFVLQDELEEIERAEARLLSVGDPVRQDGDDARELEPLEDGFENTAGEWIKLVRIPGSSLWEMTDGRQSRL